MQCACTCTMYITAVREHKDSMRHVACVQCYPGCATSSYWLKMLDSCIYTSVTLHVCINPHVTRTRTYMYIYMLHILCVIAMSLLPGIRKEKKSSKSTKDKTRNAGQDISGPKVRCCVIYVMMSL